METPFIPGLQIGRRESDFVSGTSSPIPHESRNTTKNWRQFRSVEETQRNAKGDLYNCTNESSENCFEAQANWALRNNLWPKEALDFFNAHGYIQNGVFNVSTRFNSKMSGTKWGFGNYLYKSQDSFRLDGIVPEAVWPTTPDVTHEEYYSDVPAEVIALAKESLKFYDWLYEEISNPNAQTLDKELDHAPIQIAIACCSPWYTALVPVCNDAPGHAVTLEDVEDINHAFNILDHYEPYSKRLAPGYKIYSAYKGVLYPKGSTQPVDNGIITPLYKDVVFGDYGAEVVKLKIALCKLGWLPDYRYNPTKVDQYDEELAGVVFKFQLANFSHVAVILEMLFSLAGKRVGPATRNIINESLKYK